MTTSRWAIPTLIGLLVFSLLVVIFANIMKLVDPPTYRVTITCPSGYPWYNTETGHGYSEPVS